MALKTDEQYSIHELQNRDGLEQNNHDAFSKTKGGTAADLQDMHRMGRAQELRVRGSRPVSFFSMR